jgi:hypothetical protein
MATLKKMVSSWIKSYSPFEVLFWSGAIKPSLGSRSVLLVHKFIC